MRAYVCARACIYIPFATFLVFSFPFLLFSSLFSIFSSFPLKFSFNIGFGSESILYKGTKVILNRSKIKRKKQSRVAMDYTLKSEFVLLQSCDLHHNLLRNLLVARKSSMQEIQATKQLES